MLPIVLVSLLLGGTHDETYQEWTPAPAGATELPERREPREGRGRRSDLMPLINSKPVLPFTDVTTSARSNDGGIWVGSHRGLMFLAPGANRWRVFHSRRWLPSDDIKGISVTDSGDVLVSTAAGLTRLTRRSTTLEQKMAEVGDMLSKHHVREGLVGGIQLREPGNLAAGHKQYDDDNDGLWTSMYIAAEAFHYGTTGEATAKQNARRSLDALMFLERVTGIPGFAARTIVPGSDPKPTHGEWHRSADDRWWWKGDTSSDELVGHYFAYSIYYSIAADEAEKAEIRPYVERITDHIIDHGWYYVGPPGVPTTWGVWAPEKLNHDIRRIGDRGLNSLEILSFLKVASQISDKPRYAEKAKELIEKHAYATNTVYQKNTWPAEMENHSDDELAFLSYYPLVIRERDEGLRRLYISSIQRTWMVERPEHSPLFNFIYAAGIQANRWHDPTKRPSEAMIEPVQYDRDDCVEWFRDVPADTVHWTINNSGRNDLGALMSNRFNRLAGSTMLPPSERPFMKWNGDPYQLEGGSGGSYRDDGTVILLPYWMGRYHRFID